MIPDFHGHTIDIVRLGWGLHLWTDDNWEFVLSEPVLVTTADESGVSQVEVEVDVEEQPLPEPLTGIEGALIGQVLVSREGHLSIQLQDRHLTVKSSQSYEAWQLGGPGGERMICLPGGELSHFSSLRDDSAAADEDGPDEPSEPTEDGDDESDGPA